MLKFKCDNIYLNQPKIILITKINAQNKYINVHEMHRWNIN